MKLNKLFSAYTDEDVSAICKELTGFDLSEKGLSYTDIQDHWKFVGNNPSNGSVINILSKGEKGLIERITNGIDAVIEKKVATMGQSHPDSAKSVIKVAYPKYWKNCEEIRASKADKAQAYETRDEVIVAVSDGKRASRPTYDVVDHGTGITGDKFPETILSINHGNKLSSDKKYLIGAFGQGGSTSLSFAAATILISKVNDKYWFTIVKSVDLEDYKNSVFVYLTMNGAIPEAEAEGKNSESEPDWIQKYLSFESGTFVRMVEMNLSTDIMKLDATKPHGLNDYISTELFDVGLPITLYENRKNFLINESHQGRMVYGSSLRLSTWKYLKSEYSGSLTIDYNNAPYKIDYYVILPNDERDWASDSKCRETFEQINCYGDPIVYTVNGQIIATEGFTKLKNGGLSLLLYRLLVVIDLDLLGKDKYKFFTTDRSQIKVTDSSKGLLQEVVDCLCKEEKLKDLNNEIASMSISEGLSEEKTAEIAKQVKNQYGRYLKSGGLVKARFPHGDPKPDEIVNYANEITELKLIDPKDKFFRDEEVHFLLKTGAEKWYR